MPVVQLHNLVQKIALLHVCKYLIVHIASERNELYSISNTEEDGMHNSSSELTTALHT